MTPLCQHITPDGKPMGHLWSGNDTQDLIDRPCVFCDAIYDVETNTVIEAPAHPNTMAAAWVSVGVVSLCVAIILSLTAGQYVPAVVGGCSLLLLLLGARTGRRT